MLSGVSSMLSVVMLGLPALLLFMLLPAFHELRKPKDAGPRLIIPDFAKVLPAPAVKTPVLWELETHHELDITLKPFVEVILGNLSCLEV